MRKSVVGTMLTPMQIGSLIIPNRVVFGAHTTNFAEDHMPGQRHKRYYEERARGGAGLIIMEEGFVHESDFPYEYAIFAYQQQVVRGYKTVVDAVHSHGAKIFAQLGHSGSQADSSLHQRELWSPSGMQTDAEVPKIMEIEDIKAVVEGFKVSAAHMKQASIDGIELNGGQRSLIRQFMSGLTNTRQDEYGGSLENRLRFVREVIEAIRGAVGREYPVGLRITVDEYAPWAGITPDESAEMVSILSREQQVDFFSVSVGSIYSLHMNRPSMYTPQGFTVEYAAKLKQVTDLPVICGGRIVDPIQAEAYLNEKKMDFVELTRAQIAEPEWVQKVREEQFEQIRPCIGCNQECSVYGSLNRKLSCIHNVAAGYENELGYGTIRPALTKKKVLVIGGGPAGMEAARVAALRGHQVLLCDASDQLGGQVSVAQKGPDREEISGVIRYLKNELKRLDVTVTLNLKVDMKFVEDIHPDSVVVATGAKDRWPREYMGGDLPHVMTGRLAWKLLDRQGGFGDHVAVVDEVGGYQATTLIEKLARAGKKVTVITSELFPGVSLAQTLDISPWNQRIYSLGVEVLPRMRVKAITNQHEIYLTERYSKIEMVLSNIDQVIFCLPDLPEETLYYHLQGKYRNVYRAGDCVAPRGIGMAIVEGNQVGRIL